MIAERMAKIVELFESQPYHEYLGFKVTECSSGVSQLQLSIRPELCNPVGSLHGGIIYSLCAVASSLAALSIIDDGKYTVANDFNVSVLRAVSSGNVTISGKVLKAGKRLVFVELIVYDDNNRVCAMGRVTKSILP